MIGLGLLAVSIAGMLLTVLRYSAQRHVLTRPEPRDPEHWPGVSILKPLKGVDADLAVNLESFFLLDHPHHELVFGVQDADDGAIRIVREVATRHPAVAWTLVVDERRLGLNPKVNNLANMLRHARHDVLLISDSNVRVRPAYLRGMARRLEQPGVGLVSSPIRGVSGTTLGGALETLQLNTFVMGGVATLHSVLGMPAVVGKSMMLRRADLERIGGLPSLSRFLAEDQVCGEDIAALGLALSLDANPVDNVVGRTNLRGFVGRHLRWARIRRWISPAGYLGEILLEPIPIALAAAAVLGTPAAWLYAGWVLLAQSAVALDMERRLGVRRPAWTYPHLELIRSLLVVGTWPVPWLSATVAWRGHRLRLGPRTELRNAEAPIEGSRGLVTDPRGVP